MKNKRKKLYLKISILMALLVAFFAFAIPKTYAYNLTEEGNIQSDNLLDINNYYSKSSNVIVENNTLTFGVSSPVVMQFYNSSMNFIEEFLPIISEGLQTATFTKNTNYYYLRIKSNYDNREIFYNINYLNIDSQYTISCVCSDYDTLCVLSNVMLNVGSTALSYEPFGIWYSQDNYNEAINNAVIEYQSSLTYYSLTPYTSSIRLLVSDNGVDNWQTLTTSSYLQYNVIDNFYSLNFSSLTSNKHYRIIFDLATEQYLDYMYFNNALFEKVLINGNAYSLTNLSYNGQYYYFKDLLLLDSPTSSYGFQFKATNTTYTKKYQAKGVNINLVNVSASYSKGYEEGVNSQQSIINSLQTTINNLDEELANSGVGWKSLFFAMADTPFKTVQSFLGFNVLGVNLFGAFIGFITILAILWVLKKLIK